LTFEEPEFLGLNEEKLLFFFLKPEFFSKQGHESIFIEQDLLISSVSVQIDAES